MKGIPQGQRCLRENQVDVELNAGKHHFSDKISKSASLPSPHGRKTRPRGPRSRRSELASQRFGRVLTQALNPAILGDSAGTAEAMSVKAQFVQPTPGIAARKRE